MDMWQCTECGAMFAKVGPAEIYEGVTHCTKCVEVEMLTAMVGRLETERDELLAARDLFLRWIKDPYPEVDGAPTIANVEDAMRAAIAKAKGEQP